MIDYVAIEAGAAQAIAEAGASVTLKRLTSSRDALSGTVTATAVATSPATVVLLPRFKGAYDKKLTAGLLNRALKGVLIAVDGLTFTPEPNDYLEIAGEHWRIVGITPIAPAGTNVLFKGGVGLVGNLPAIVAGDPETVTFNGEELTFNGETVTFTAAA